MPLPQLHVPTFAISLPSTGQNVKLRPYLVKEQKILLMAQQSEEENEIVSAIKQTITNCLVNNDLDIGKLPVFDIEYIFLKLRSKSVGESIDLVYTCGQTKSDPAGTADVVCGGKFKHRLDIDILEVKKNPENNRVIQLDQSIGMTLKFPTYEIFTKYKLLSTDIQNNSIDAIFGLIGECTENIFTGEQVYEEYTKEELANFIGDMNDTQFKQIVKFFDTLPKLDYTVNFLCPKCGYSEKIVLQSLVDFSG